MGAKWDIFLHYTHCFHCLSGVMHANNMAACIASMSRIWTKFLISTFHWETLFSYRHKKHLGRMSALQYLEENNS